MDSSISTQYERHGWPQVFLEILFVTSSECSEAHASRVAACSEFLYESKSKTHVPEETKKSFPFVPLRVQRVQVRGIGVAIEQNFGVELRSIFLIRKDYVVGQTGPNWAKWVNRFDGKRMKRAESLIETMSAPGAAGPEEKSVGEPGRLRWGGFGP